MSIPTDATIVSIDNLIRQFETGATRSPDAERYDPEGFMSPIVNWIDLSRRLSGARLRAAQTV